MSLGDLKPFLSALVLPPVSPLLLALAGVLLVGATRRRRTGIGLALAGIGSLWLLSCHAVAILLWDALLPLPPAVQPAQLANVQAIVVLGGGLRAKAPEFGHPELGPASLSRARYGAWLARQTGKPLAYSGGTGWMAMPGAPPEAAGAKYALEDWGVTPRWVDSRSRDTAENARETQRLLAADSVSRIALVTDAWHMPRAVLEFERAGLKVLAAPTNLPQRAGRPMLEWIPSPEGLALSRTVIRERLGLLIARLKG
jgi:uncharacterized SAM-binding protein YcdF (DUF218 family)